MDITLSSTLAVIFDASFTKPRYRLPTKWSRFDTQRTGDWYVKLQDVGNVHTISLATPEHVVTQVVWSMLHARENGHPFIYNTSAFGPLENYANATMESIEEMHS